MDSLVKTIVIANFVIGFLYLLMGDIQLGICHGMVATLGFLISE